MLTAKQARLAAQNRRIVRIEKEYDLSLIEKAIEQAVERGVVYIDIPHTYDRIVYLYLMDLGYVYEPQTNNTVRIKWN